MGIPSAEQFTGWLFSRLIEHDLFEYIPRDNIKLIAERTAQFFYQDGVLEGGELLNWFTGEHGLSEEKVMSFLTLIREEALTQEVKVLFPGEAAPKRKVNPKKKGKKAPAPSPPPAPLPPQPKAQDKPPPSEAPLPPQLKTPDQPLSTPDPAKVKAFLDRKRKAILKRSKSSARPEAIEATVDEPGGLFALTRSNPKLLLGALVLALLFTVFLYTFLIQSRVKDVELDLADVGIIVDSTQESDNMLIVMVEQSDWNALPGEERGLVAGRLYDAAKRSGYDQVQLKSTGDDLIAQVSTRDSIIWFQ